MNDYIRFLSVSKTAEIKPGDSHTAEKAPFAGTLTVLIAIGVSAYLLRRRK